MVAGGLQEGDRIVLVDARTVGKRLVDELGGWDALAAPAFQELWSNPATRSGMRLDAGDVVLVPFPFTDLKASKTRPAFVLSRREYNDSSRDVVVCGVTSYLANSAHSVLVTPKDMADGKLVVESRVKVDKLVTLQQTLVRRKVGSVKRGVLERVLAELNSLSQEWP